MDPRISIITLGVSDMAKSKKFYLEGLGWKSLRDSKDGICFIPLNGIILGLYPLDKLAEDAGLDPRPKPGFGGVTLAHNVESEAEVDALLAKAAKAGARILQPAEQVFWGGYRGYFSDPDGYPWEVAYNPHWALDAEGRLEGSY